MSLKIILLFKNFPNTSRFRSTTPLTGNNKILFLSFFHAASTRNIYKATKGFHINIYDFQQAEKIFSVTRRKKSFSLSLSSDEILMKFLTKDFFLTFFSINAKKSSVRTGKRWLGWRRNNFGGKKFVKAFSIQFHSLLSDTYNCITLKLFASPPIAKVRKKFVSTNKEE